MLHAVWRDGLVVFGWRGRTLDYRTASSLASTVFLDSKGQLEEEQLLLTVPGRARPLEVTGFRVPVELVSEAYSARPWVPWRSFSASLAWFADVARLANDLADRALVVPTLAVAADGATARWQPVVIPEVATSLAALARQMPPVVGALTPDSEPWQLTSAAVDAFVDDSVRVRLWGAGSPDPAPRNKTAPATMARRFLTALVDDRGEVLVKSPAEQAAVTELSQRLRSWAAPLRARSVLSDLVARVRIVPPTDLELDDSTEWGGLNPEEQPWLAGLELSPADDQSLVVDAPDIWHDPRAAAALSLTSEQAQDALRAVVARVQRAAPTVAAALDPERPGHALLSLDQLLIVLESEAAALTAAGVEVLLPGWWGRKATAKVRGSATAERAVTSAGLEARSLAQVEWSLVLGGEHLDEAELTRLANTKAPLVFAHGRWVAFDPAQVRHALTTLTAHRRDVAPLGPLELMQLASDPDEDVEVQGDGWIDELLQGLPDDQLTPLVEPSTFTGTLRPYQQRGLGWLAFLQRLGLGGCLADDMGLGKTAQVLALLAHERVEAVGPIGPTLVVCPLSVVRNWESEAARFTPHLTVLVHHGTQRHTDSELVNQATASDLVVTTYATATRDVAVLSTVAWQRLVADEAQHVKNASTAAARALRRIPAQQKLALTGTPVENRLSELWAICDLVNPGLLGNAARFRERFAIPIERNRDADATARLRQLVQPFVLRRSKSDRALVPELPPKVEQVAWATLTREQASLYRSVTDHLLRSLDSLEGMDRRGAILASITRLKQICNHPAHFLGDGSKLEGRSGKLSRFDELVADALDSDGTVLVFTQYRKMGELLVRHLHERNGIEAPFLHGGVPKARRDSMVDRLQDGSSGPVLVVSLKAGGSGLNLTAANHVVHYDRWWNPAVENQASDRAWRIGQQRAVLVSKLVCQGTIEDRIDALMNAKADLFERVMGPAEGWLTELTTDELRELLVLREER
ncbi:MAG: putative helicase, family [Acidimicrobiia bacterium]|nr:putative helicase, family [Acidimicrobiia bacterium]